MHLGVSVLVMKIISNYLTQGDYGIYASIVEYALFFSVAANLGIFGNTVREMSKAPHDGKLFVNVLLLRVITALIFFVSAVLYLVFGGFDEVFVIGTFLFCSALFFDYVTSVCDGMLQANYLMGRATAALVVGRVVLLGVIYCITAYVAPEAGFANIPLLFLAVISASFVTAGMSLFFVMQKIELKFSFDRAFMMKILMISLPFGIINILNSLYFRFLPDYFSRGIMTDEQFATFNVSFKIAQVLGLFSTILMYSVLPGFKQYLVNENWTKVRFLIKWISIILIGAGVAIVVFGSLLGPFMLEVLTHKKYFLPEFWFVLPLMLLLSAISYGYDLVLITLFAMNKEMWFLKREFFALIFAGLLFGASFWIDTLELKILFIILGAIVGELVMVVLGGIKVRKLLRES